MDERAIVIQVFVMSQDRIAKRHETPEYWDILVSYEPDEGGKIEVVEEHDDLTETQVGPLVDQLQEKYGVSAEFVSG